MENNTNAHKDGPGFSDVVLSERPTLVRPNIKSINLSGDKWVIVDDLPGVYLEGIQYYDLKNIGFINNTGMANLIELLKSLLEQGVAVEFVNVNKSIKDKIRSLGLDHILICS